MNLATYSTFLGGDSAIIEYSRPEANNQRRLMVIKDSYANAFITWLIPSFDKIIVVDPLFCREDVFKLAEEEEITDFLVLDYVLATTMEPFINELARLSGLTKE